MKTHEIESLAAERAWVTRLATRMLRDRDAAEDVAQDTLVAALESPPPTDRPVRGWLGRVATNVVRGRHRSSTRRSRREQVAVTESDAEAADTFSSLLQQQAAAHLASALADLPDPFHTAIRLRFFDDLSVAEVAARQGVPIGTAGWRISEGVKRLRGALDDRASGDARTWLMALVPGISIPVSSSVPFEATAPASARGGTNMSNWIGIGIAATLIGAGTVVTVVAASASGSAPDTDPTTRTVLRATEPSTSARPAVVAPAADPVAAAAVEPPLATKSSAHTRTPSGGGVIVLMKRSGPGAEGELPKALYGDVSEYGPMLFECFDVHGAGPDSKARAMLRLSMIQDPDQGPIIDDSAYDASHSSIAEPEFGDCLRSVGLAIKLDEPLGPAGTRYEVDMHLRRDMPVKIVGERASERCLGELKRRNPGTDYSRTKVDDPEFTRCLTEADDTMILADKTIDAMTFSDVMSEPFSRDAIRGVERCAEDLTRRRPELGSRTATVDDDPAFTRCVEEALGVEATGRPRVVMLDGNAELGDVMKQLEHEVHTMEVDLDLRGAKASGQRARAATPKQ